jgi:hypothetical protein
VSLDTLVLYCVSKSKVRGPLVFVTTDIHSVQMHRPHIAAMTLHGLPSQLFSHPTFHWDNEQDEHITLTPVISSEQQRIPQIFPSQPPLYEDVRGMSNAAIGTLPIYLARSGAIREVCAICHETFATDRFYRQLPCGHQFHPNCIGEWLSRSRKCPTCRGVVK